MNGEELRAKLAEGESQRVEFKENAKSALREAVCALANDLENSKESGYLFVGVDDSGRLTALSVDDKLLQLLAQIRSDGALQPLPSISVERVECGNGAYAVVAVRPCDDPPMRYRGRVWVRVGSTTQIASRADERQLVERRRHAATPFDHRAVDSATIADLSLEFFQHSYLPSAYAPDILESNGRSTGEQLESLRFASHTVPTIGGIIVCGSDPLRFVPGAYVQFVIFAGKDVTAATVDEKIASGRIDVVASSTIELLRLTLAVALYREDGARDLRIPRYPLLALTEIAINALMHRNYDGTNAPVRIYVFEDRIEISNPGGPFGTVSSGTFGRRGVTDYRNPILADALKTLGFAQRFGYGIPAARKALAENGNPAPRFEVERDFVNVVIEAVHA